MNQNNIKKVKAIEAKNRKRLLALNPNLDDKSGIYILTRKDENGFKFCYVGQAKHLTSRLCQHLADYKQHIDLSLKKHGLYSTNNEHGWKVGFQHFPESMLDQKEQEYIKQYALCGHQMLNKTSGSQGEGKTQIAEFKASRGYRDGLAQGKKNLARELSHIIDKHLVVSLKEEKKNNKVSIKAMDKFWSLLEGEEDGEISGTQTKAE